MKAVARYLGISLAICLLAAGAGIALMQWRAAHAPIVYRATWSPQAAARYLDAREDGWPRWRSTHRGQGTYCVSCHTQVPYVVSRTTLEQPLGETGPNPRESAMVANIAKRVEAGDKVAPYFADARFGAGKTAQSRSTEAVLNAVVLATYDAQSGRLQSITRTAFDRAWAYQDASGGWPWEIFSLPPWESGESAYQGAAWLQIALTEAPGNYAQSPAIQPNATRLRHYLQAGYAAQPLMSQLYVLWASKKTPQLLTAPDRGLLIARLRQLQRADGGWSLYSIDDPPGSARIGAPQSDGCATGLILVALEESGVDSSDPMLERGLAWLEHHQTEDGSWRANSLNEKRNPTSNIGRFMSDAATGYAVLALEIARKRAVITPSLLARQ